jgi:hypothetical protein
MKLKINKRLRKVLMIIVIVLITTVSFFLYKSVKHTGFKDEKVSLYSYENKGNISYNVFLKPNILYNDNSIGEGNVYLTEFVDYINAVFNYEFKGEKEADIKGNYDITAVAEGSIGEKETYKTIWKKEFELLPKTNFELRDKDFAIKKEIPIKYEEYNNFAKQVIQDSKFGLQVKLLVSMNVNLKADTGQGIIEEKMSPTMIIPLNTSFFEITGELSKNKPGAIEGTKKIQVPVNKKKVIAYSSLLAILTAALLFLIFFTSVFTADDPFTKSLNKIFKNYGDRLVALNDDAVVLNENISNVKSMEDLVKVSDEIGRPIVYKHSYNLKDINEFYVFDSNQSYVFNLMNFLKSSRYKEFNKEERKPAEDKSKSKKSILGFKPALSNKEKSETKDIKS